MSPIAVSRIDTTDTFDLRRRVLRTGTASTDVHFAGDDIATHLGAFVDGALIGISTWVPATWPPEPDRRSLQLRGMATEPRLQGFGVGGTLLAAGLLDAWAHEIDVVFANARLEAVDFYVRNGFRIDGAIFDDPTTGLDHQRIVQHRPMDFPVGRPPSPLD